MCQCNHCAIIETSEECQCCIEFENTVLSMILKIISVHNRTKTF